MSSWARAESLAISALSGAAFDTMNQMNAAYDIAEEVIAKAMLELVEEAVIASVGAVDRATWNMCLAEEVGREVRKSLLKPTEVPA